jgi:hypothetical protein
MCALSIFVINNNLFDKMLPVMDSLCARRYIKTE